MTNFFRPLALIAAIMSALAFIYVLWLVNPDYTPKILSDFLFRNIGERPYFAPPKTATRSKIKPQPMCPPVGLGWHKAQTIDGIDVAADPQCSPDNPSTVAASVKGTNNIDQMVLMDTPFAPDTLIKGKDLDGDGDPDEIEINLEVTELNGHSPDAPIKSPGFSIAPGVQPGFWVFTPKVRGMATENLETMVAARHLRVPSVPIRIEQGDTVKITLHNTHYMPHTIHLHGTDHPYQDANGEGNDGIPGVSEMPIMPGESRTYNLTPRQAGTMLYHCHVQTDTHVPMGLIGMFVIEENRPNNWVQTFNIGGGLVRHSSVAVREKYNREFDMQYQEADKDLNNIISTTNDPRIVSKKIHREHNITNSDPEYYMLNGKSFPYTLRESLIILKEGEKVKVRLAVTGAKPISLHTHGHKFTITHLDGIEQPPAAQITRDVIFISAAQRADIAIEATNDGLHSYGPGIWLFHDHQEASVTTDGISPGGDISMITYEQFLADNGLPKVAGDISPMFTPEYYQGKVPVFAHMDPNGFWSDPTKQSGNWIKTLLIACLPLLLALFIGSLMVLSRGQIRRQN